MCILPHLRILGNMLSQKLPPNGLLISLLHQRREGLSFPRNKKCLGGCRNQWERTVYSCDENTLELDVDSTLLQLLDPSYLLPYHFSSLPIQSIALDAGHQQQCGCQTFQQGCLCRLNSKYEALISPRCAKSTSSQKITLAFSKANSSTPTFIQSPPKC